MDPRKKLSHFTVDRPVAVLMVFIAAVVFGFFSYNRLPVTLMPELNYPTLTVRTEFPGAAPEEVENDVSRPIEEALGVVGGLNRISSISRAGVSDVVLEFVWGTDMAEATQNTLEKLDLVFLPQEVERPLILHFDPSLDPIMELSFSGTGARFKGEQGLRRLRRIAELQVRRALEPIKGVAAVRIRGGLEEEIHVLIDEKKLLRSGLSIETVISRLRDENINVAGGNVKEGRAEYMIRTLNEYENLEQIADTVIQRYEGNEVRVRDLGRVIHAHKEREIMTRTDGEESVQIDIYKEADANVVSVAKQVVARIGKLPENIDPDEPPTLTKSPMGQKNKGLAEQLYQEEGAKLQVVADRSLFIESSIKEVRDNAVMGGLLAIIVLFLFLNNIRATFIIAVTIPMSLLITFAPLNLMGVSLNIMSLGGLALGVGMLVDAAIVVIESIFRCQEEGDDLRTAAIRGTEEVKGAVISSVLTTVVVFFPMVFVEGIAGQAFGDLGMAVVISLMASMYVALYFIPMLASREPIKLTGVEAAKTRWTTFKSWEIFRNDLAATQGPKRWLLLPYFIVRLVLAAVFEVIGKLILLLFSLIGLVIVRVLWPVLGGTGKLALGAAVRVSMRFMNRLNNWYPYVIRWALKNAAFMFVIVTITFFITCFLALKLNSELLPEVHQGEFTFEVSLPVGTPIEETDAILTEVERTILANKEDIQSVLVTFGYDITNMKRSDEGEHSARFKILLRPNNHQAATEDRVLARLRKYFADLPDVNTRVVRPVLFSSQTPIVVEIHGDNLDELKAYATRAQTIMAQMPELADVESTLKSGAPEVEINYERDKLMRYGLNISTVARQVRDMVKGFEATRFNLQDRRIPILVRLEETDRQQVDNVGRLTINAGGEQPIPLSAIADLKIGEGPSEVRRVDGQRVALIQANIGQGSLGGAVKQITERLNKEIDWPTDMTFYITGQNEEWERSKLSLYLALGLSLFLVYAIMAAQFESLMQPLIIMLTVPLAFVGVVVALVTFDIAVSVMVFLGAITLVGVVVNNAIVLIDYINILRGRGMEIHEAIATAGRVRLRPIFLTTGTTVLGLLPMALGFGDGAEIRTPMAVTVITGIVSSTVLTLVIIPTFYLMMERLKMKFFKSKEPADSPAPEATPNAT